MRLNVLLNNKQNQGNNRKKAQKPSSVNDPQEPANKRLNLKSLMGMEMMRTVADKW